MSEGRAEAIARYGAEVVRVPGNYDDAVRHAAAEAASHGWFVVSDTSYEGYRDVPIDVMHGYGVMAAEIFRQLPAGEVPTHVFVQVGVGALAAAICASFWLRGGRAVRASSPSSRTARRLPVRSLEAGGRSSCTAISTTVMAGLACGEVSELAWEILARARSGASPSTTPGARGGARAPPPATASRSSWRERPSGGAGCAAGGARTVRDSVRARLDAGASVLLLGSEGDTDRRSTPR